MCVNYLVNNQKLKEGDGLMLDYKLCLGLEIAA